MRILICGAGAIGSNLTARLVSDLKGHEITVLDKDTVEQRNIIPGTQFYTVDQIGLPKVEALQFNIYKWYQKEINIINQELTTSNAMDTLNAHDLILDCLDNHRSRKITQSFWINYGIREILHVGFSNNYTFSVEWADGYKVPSDIIKGIDICEMLGAAAFVNSVASLGALVAEEFITNGKKLEITGGKFVHSLIK